MAEKKIKVLFLSKTDGQLGACRAAYRFFDSFKELPEFDCRMAVRIKSTNDARVIKTHSWRNFFGERQSQRLDRALTYMYPQRRSSLFSFPWLGGDSWKEVYKDFKPDILHLHWVGHGFLTPKSLEDISCPIVWTMHDMWPFTGGCHYSGSCHNYMNHCGHCDVLQSKSGSDLSSVLWKRKNNSWASKKISFVSPSQWLADLAKKSSLCTNQDVRVIANGLSLDDFCAVEKTKAKMKLGLDASKKLVVSGAMNFFSDKRKGADAYKALYDSLDENQRKNMIFACFGEGTRNFSVYEGNGFISLGKIDRHGDLVDILAAADIFVCFSSEDNLPQMPIEAMACGASVIAFNVGGLKDIVDEGENGYLVEFGDILKASQRLQELAADEAKLEMFSLSARKKTETCFDIHKQRMEYAKLYRSLAE